MCFKRYDELWTEPTFLGPTHLLGVGGEKKRRRRGFLGNRSQKAPWLQPGELASFGIKRKRILIFLVREIRMPAQSKGFQKPCLPVWASGASLTFFEQVSNFESFPLWYWCLNARDDFFFSCNGKKGRLLEFWYLCNESPEFYSWRHQKIFTPSNLTFHRTHSLKVWNIFLKVTRVHYSSLVRKTFSKGKKVGVDGDAIFSLSNLSDVSNTHSPISTPFSPNPFSISSDTHNFATFRHFPLGIVFVMLALGSVF